LLAWPAVAPVSPACGFCLVMNTVIAPIDFSRASLAVVDEAVRLARSVEGRVVVLHVVKPPAFAGELAPVSRLALHMTAEVERVAREQLLLMQRRLMKRGISVETLCTTGSPIRRIVEQAETQAARYIVLGGQRRTALEKIVVGSTASGVLKRAGCPVVVVPPPRKAAAVAA
jgi:nucleotide-binding universal stress UspA family protein